MGDSSFVQSSFLGGEWSNYSQGRMESERYKTALNVCLNGYPLEEGSWSRRQGTRWLATTKGGLAARLISFQFDTDEPFQVEFGTEYARLFLGTSQVFTADQQNVVSISTATPALVTTGTHGWVDGNTVMFFFTAGDDGDQHDNAPTLRNRQFTIDQQSATTFLIYDAITGEAVDGNTLNYTAPGGIVKRIFEITTPYTGVTWQNIRKVQDQDAVVYLNPAFKPTLLEVGTSLIVPFTITSQVFIDGPYMDPNTTSTTLDPSGVSGSVTLVASAVTGINGGQGFLPTDVGRLIRLFWEPATWSSGSAYAVGDVVEYNDQYFVNVVATAAAAPNPERDVASWTFATDATVWTWGTITARASTTSVTFNIQGKALPDATARLVWRLGLYSDTTGWPAIGGFHDGRLWLGGVQPNRIDGSVANSENGFFDFAPSLFDGSVTDANAISAFANSEDRCDAVWMATDDAGILVGTEGGEWRGRASVNNDPISPTNFDYRRVTKAKCHNAETVRTPTMQIFIQLSRRKIMEWGYFEGDGYRSAHLSLTGRHLTVSGMSELAYQQEPVPIVWGRREDGGLIGSVYKRDPEEGYHAAWFSNELGGERVTTSISSGASITGLSEALYQVSLGLDGVHFVEILSPIFEDDTEAWKAFFVDSGITPQAGVLSGSNIIFYGFWPLVGESLAVMVNGIDTGDYTVAADGSLTVPLGSTDSGYTQADLQALSDEGTDFGEFGVYIDFGAAAVSSPTDQTGKIMAHIGAADDVVGVTGQEMLMDANRDRIFVFKEGTAATSGIRRFNTTDGAEEAQANIEGIFGVGSGKSIDGPSAMDSAGNVYIITSSMNQRRVDKIDPVSLTSVGACGTPSSYIGAVTDGNGLPAPITMCCVRTVNGYNFLVSAGFNGDVTFVNATDMKFAGQAFNLDEDDCSVVEGAYGTGVAWAIDYDAAPTATAFGLYKFEIGTNAPNWTPPSPMSNWTLVPNTEIVKTKVGTVPASDVNAAWTRWLDFSSPAFDKTDGNLIMLVKGDDGAGGTVKQYIIKINVTTTAIVWATEIAGAIDTFGIWGMNKNYIDDSAYAFITATAAGNDRILTLLNTTTGAATSQTWTGIQPTGSQCFNSITGGILLFGTYSDLAGNPNPTAEVGDYFDTHSTDTFTSQWARIFPRSGQASGGGNLRTYIRIPSIIGYTFTSRGQILRPDAGNDAGARNGPAFGKTRRLHEFSAYVLRTRGISFGIDFGDSLRPGDVRVEARELEPGELYTGLIDGTMDCAYDTEGKLAWEITRPYPATVTAVSGYLHTQDK